MIILGEEVHKNDSLIEKLFWCCGARFSYVKTKVITSYEGSLLQTVFSARME